MQRRSHDTSYPPLSIACILVSYLLAFSTFCCSACALRLNAASASTASWITFFADSTPSAKCFLNHRSSPSQSSLALATLTFAELPDFRLPSQLPLQVSPIQWWESCRLLDWTLWRLYHRPLLLCSGMFVSLRMRKWDSAATYSTLNSRSSSLINSSLAHAHGTWPGSWAGGSLAAFSLHTLSNLSNSTILYD